MKKNLPAFAVLLLVFTASSASAAIQYEFRQTTSSDLESIPSTDCVGRAIIDGDRSRVEFTAGNAYPAGTYIIATNGSRSMVFVDPSRKSFVEVNAASVATSIGGRKITITNKKIEDVVKMPDQTTVAGLPTEHYRLSMSYDITVAFGNLPLTQTVKTTIDKWTTSAFGDIGDTFLAGGALKTGNPDLDELMSAENSRIKGFALRQVVNVTTINTRTAPSDSQLKVNRTVTQTRELLVTSIQPLAKLNVATFTIPVTYQKAGPIHDDTQKSPVQVLSMEPAEKQ